jgi:hypothetical protein
LSTTNKLPTSGPSFVSNNDILLQKIKESEEGKGQIQMVSGGFGDSTQLDEETMRLLAQH